MNRTLARTSNLRVIRSIVVVSLFAVTGMACAGTTAQPPTSPTQTNAWQTPPTGAAAGAVAAGSPRAFEGHLDFEGASAGRPLSGTCIVKGDLARCNVPSHGVYAGINGTLGTLCVGSLSAPMPFAVVPARLAFQLAALFPDIVLDLRATRARPTGRTFSSIGRTCTEYGSPEDDGGTRTACFDMSLYFQGHIPIFQPFPPDVRPPLGIELAIEERDRDGRVKGWSRTTRIVERSVNPGEVVGC